MYLMKAAVLMKQSQLRKFSNSFSLPGSTSVNNRSDKVGKVELCRWERSDEINRGLMDELWTSNKDNVNNLGMNRINGIGCCHWLSVNLYHQILNVGEVSTGRQNMLPMHEPVAEQNVCGYYNTP
ncbi:hypothetical protein NQ318_015774 [Aromia moschata]|uniref:Uncharacterized protein n=1 Tax=Aromia moschata TaxID=1265417 RepID=A0AAV8XNC3_9CUCU|nr:hypothetical protein NQ318_015774 [Aromia moschata]